MTHIPLRMCAVCRTHVPQEQLIRITCCSDNDTAIPDGDKKNMGRGAYICRSAQCIEKAKKKHVIERHLGCSACDTLYERLEGMI